MVRQSALNKIADKTRGPRPRIGKSITVKGGKKNGGVEQLQGAKRFVPGHGNEAAMIAIRELGWKSCKTKERFRGADNGRNEGRAIKVREYSIFGQRGVLLPAEAQRER